MSVDEQIRQAMQAANELSKVARAEGDLPTMYVANRAWHELGKAWADRLDRQSALRKA